MLIQVFNLIGRYKKVAFLCLLVWLFLIPAQSLLWAENVPIAMKLLGIIVFATAFFRPTDGLLVVAAIGPLGITLGRILGSQARGSEALVLAFLAGWLLQSFLRISDDTKRALGNLFIPLLLFGLVVVTSGIERLIFLQFQTDYPWPFLQSFGSFFARNYLLGPGNFGFVQTALRLLEGLALFACTVSICRADKTIIPRLIRALVAGGIGAALLSLTFVIIQSLQITSISEDEIAYTLQYGLPLWTVNFFKVLASQRWSVHIGDMNAAGSYFVLIFGIAIGATLNSTRWKVVWLVASLINFVGLWLTGSETAIITSFLILAITVVWFAVKHFRLMPRWRIVVLTLFAMVSIACLLFLYSPLVLNQESLDALNIRRLFVVTTLGMVSSRPLFGVGVGGYYLWSAHFSPPELLNIFYRENAHNYFLQIAGELGLVGIAAFGWLLFTSLKSALPNASIIRRNPLQFGLISGIVAFLITCLTGHPLLVPEVIYPFWIALAISTANSTEGIELQETIIQKHEISPQNNDTFKSSGMLIKKWLILSIAIFLFAAIPARVKREIQDLDVTKVEYGFYNWEEDTRNTKFRWTGRRARFHVSASTQTIELPIRGNIEDSSSPLELEVFIDSQSIRRVKFSDNSWYRIRVDLPQNSSAAYRRIDLYSNQTFVPRNNIPGSTDARELGVRIGEVVIVR